MNASSLLFLLLVLACPLMMVFMMRGHGGHAHGHGSHGGSDEAAPQAKASLQELRTRLDELESQIEEREAEESGKAALLARREPVSR